MEKQAALLLALCAMFLWGSWANTLLLFRTRFELYLFNYILGHFLAGFITFHDALPSLHGLGADGIWIIIVSLLAGALFAIGSLLAVASLDLAGMALPTLILLSIEMAVGMPMLLLLEGWGTSMQLVYSFLGIFSVLVAALLDAWCHWSLQRDRTTPAEEIPGQCFGLSSQFSSLSFWSFRATSTLASGAGVNSANSLVRSLAPEALTFLTHGSVFPSSMSSQQVVTSRSGCLLSIQAGRILGNAMAMSITRCQPLVCASWGVLVWGELNGAGYKTTLIFTGMLLMFLLALIFFLLATAGAS